MSFRELNEYVRSNDVSLMDKIIYAIVLKDKDVFDMLNPMITPEYMEKFRHKYESVVNLIQYSILSNNVDMYWHILSQYNSEKYYPYIIDDVVDIPDDENRYRYLELLYLSILEK